ncbi:hypothetical protein G7046_g1971 [Stylonectria norvegica]|nr:hypothetical protein G7046_g1971 [Stylonectria norvegica]
MRKLEIDRCNRALTRSYGNYCNNQHPRVTTKLVQDWFITIFGTFHLISSGIGLLCASSSTWCIVRMVPGMLQSSSAKKEAHGNLELGGDGETALKHFPGEALACSKQAGMGLRARPQLARVPLLPLQNPSAHLWSRVPLRLGAARRRSPHSQRQREPIATGVVEPGGGSCVWLDPEPRRHPRSNHYPGWETVCLVLGSGAWALRWLVRSGRAPVRRSMSSASAGFPRGGMSGGFGRGGCDADGTDHVSLAIGCALEQGGSGRDMEGWAALSKSVSVTSTEADWPL